MFPLGKTVFTTPLRASLRCWRYGASLHFPFSSRLGRSLVGSAAKTDFNLGLDSALNFYFYFFEHCVTSQKNGCEGDYHKRDLPLLSELYNCTS